jgi:Na+-transporting methylmalonyl-CoA/oxaloacetate decarboxylase gamma subunit
MTTMISALQITAIGMGLVFVSLLLLWGLMEGMMRLTARSAAVEAAQAAEAAEEPCEPEEAPGEITDAAVLRRRAAAAAVAVALAMKPVQDGHLLRPPAETASVWQSVLRANQLSQRAQVVSQKQRGNLR